MSKPSPTPELSDRLIRVPEAAERLGLDKSMVYRLLDQGVIRAARFGRARRVSLKSLEAYIAARSRGPEVAPPAPEPPAAVAGRSATAATPATLALLVR